MEAYPVDLCWHVNDDGSFDVVGGGACFRPGEAPAFASVGAVGKGRTP